MLYVIEMTRSGSKPRPPSLEADAFSVDRQGGKEREHNLTKKLRPKIHGFTGCKRTGFVKPDSVKLAMGHLLHGEAAP